MWEALEALNHDLERDHLVGIVAAGSMSRRAYALLRGEKKRRQMQPSPARARSSRQASSIPGGRVSIAVLQGFWLGDSRTVNQDERPGRTHPGIDRDPGCDPCGASSTWGGA
jgi:hypothetical protein